MKSFNSPIPSQSKLKSARSAQVSSCIQGMLRGGTALVGGVHLYLAAALRHACVKVSSNSCACGRISWSLKFFSFFFFLVFGFLFLLDLIIRVRRSELHVTGILLLGLYVLLDLFIFFFFFFLSSCLDRRLCLLGF